MDRKYGKNPRKKTEKNVKSIPKDGATKIEYNEEDADLHASLSDSIFKDSFDKFLGDRGDRRKQLNLKENVRASFNRDSSFELSAISEPDSTASSVDIPLKATSTICSTPNVKFSNLIGTLTTPRNDSSDLFASYAVFELNESQESATKSQLNSHGDSDRVCALSETPANIDNRFDEFISRGRGAGRRAKRTLLTSTDAPGKKLNDTHGDACDVKSTEQENLFQTNETTTNNLEPITNSRLEIAELSTHNDENDYNAIASTSKVQLGSADSSAEEEIDFFKHLRKRPMRDLRSALVNSLTFAKRMSSSYDASVDSVEVKSSIDQNNTDTDRYGSYIEISSLLTDSVPCELSKLSDRHSSNSFNIKLEDVSKVSSSTSCNISSREPRFSKVASIVTETVNDVGSRKYAKFCLRRTLLEMMKEAIAASFENDLSSNSNLVSPHSTANSTHMEANDCNNKTQYSEHGTAPHHSLDFHTELSSDTLDPSSNSGNKKFDHSITSPFCKDKCDITAADSVDDVFRCVKHEQHEASDLQKSGDVEDDKTVTRTILEMMKQITDSSESTRMTTSADSSDDIFRGMDNESTDARTLADDKTITRTILEMLKEIKGSSDSKIANASADSVDDIDDDSIDTQTVSDNRNMSIRRNILQMMKRITDSCHSNLTNATGTSVCELTTDNSSSNSVSGVSSANSTQTESSNLGNTNTDQSIATPHSNDKCDLTAANHPLEQPEESNVIQTTSKERPDINVSKRRRCNFKRLVTPVKSSNDIVSSQYVVTRKKPKLFDTSESNVHNVSNTTVITDTKKASAIPSTLVQPSTNEVGSPKNCATDPSESSRKHLRDIGNTINCINVTKRKRYLLTNPLHMPAINESSENDQVEDENEELLTTTSEFNGQKMSIDNDLYSLTLRPGKWRRSISLYRRHSISARSAFLLEQTDVESINSLKISLSNESNRQRLRHSVSFNFVGDNYADLNETSDRRAARRRRTSVVNPYVDAGRLTEFDFRSTYEARDTILRKCGQSEPLEFADVYSQGALRHCRKIVEGVYGEVFMNKTDAGRAIVLKIIPIVGLLEVNGEPQKKFDEVLSEIVIALQLSSLRNDKEYMTSSFAEVVQVRCVQGRYPNHLIDLWELYRDNYQTENDHPEVFGDDQLYIVFELRNGGQDLEAFQFSNALQAKSTFQQMALALAIAEKKLQFEHRDLHWGNILLSPTDEKFINFKFNGNTLQIPSEGIKVTIIDYTLSRMLYDGIVLYNDLSNDDELFTAHGDYQFDIYRLMKSNLDNDWQRFVPFNNILWLHYIVDKLINGARYKNTKSRKHRLAIEDLMVIRDEITNYKSAVESVSII